MQVLQIKVLDGPNYWSNHHTQLIVMKVDLKEYEYLPTNLIENFSENLEKLIPSLKSHYCSEKHEGGFLERLKDGTWLGHVIEHVALELQCLANMDCGFGRTRSTHKMGVYHVVFAYQIAEAGLYAAKIAFRLVKTLARGQSYENLQHDIYKLNSIFNKKGFGISTKSILEEAKNRNIPITILHDSPLIMLGYGSEQKLLSTTITSHTSCIGVDFSSNKNFTKDILSNAYIPVPHGAIFNNFKQLHRAINTLCFPLVVKPINGNHGQGVTTNIQNKDQLIKAFKHAQKISTEVIIEPYIAGFDFRFLVINYKLVAVAKRIPAMIIGDGYTTIQNLIDRANNDLKRGEAHENILTNIKIDDITRTILREKNLNLNSVLPLNQILYLKHAANLSSGGTAINVTAMVHPKNKILAERIARLFHLDICGIDIIAKNINLPITQNEGAVIEVNAAPGLRMHISPSEGEGIQVGKYIVDMLFPSTKNPRIPIVAVTGTNGKTTTVRLISHFAMKNGKSVGMTTTDGIYLNDELLFCGDCSGPKSAKAILSDATVNFAVLECARGGILRSGLGFDQCDIGIVMNISDDHLGLDEIETLTELARVKAVVPKSVKPTGYAILNADDDLVYGMKKDLKCNIALFSVNPNNVRIQEHCANGGIAAYVENSELIIYQNHQKINLTSIENIPLAKLGKATCMIQNILASILAGIISNFSTQDMVNGLETFNQQLHPGRMNIFDLGAHKVLLDYAHNVSAFQKLEKYLNQIHCVKKIGIIGTPGDRRSKDIKNLGFFCAKMFDEIIIRHDKDGRGRTNEEITTLLCEGINAYDAMKPVMVISDEQEALVTVLKNAQPGSFIVYCPEKIFEGITFLTQLSNSSKRCGITYAA